MKEIIKETLAEHFHPTLLDVQDDSERHSGHAEAKKHGGGHYTVTITSGDFRGKTLVERHRMVNAALKPHFASGIHALRIIARTPEEDTP